MKGLVAEVFAPFLVSTVHAVEIVQEDIKIPVTVKTLFGSTVGNLAVRIYRPAAEGMHLWQAPVEEFLRELRLIP